MNQFWSIVLDILIFLLSLSVLIILHEFGHLLSAKAFKVYCYEYSIGMGPALYKKKPNREKGQETIYSIRALPIGGYVSMAGEDMAEAEGADTSIEVPKERTLEGKPRWQRFIIMGAGVTMNFLLGFLLLIINYTGLPQNVSNVDAPIVSVAEKITIDGTESTTVAYQHGLRSGDTILTIDEIFYFSNNTQYHYNNGPVNITAYYSSKEPSDYRTLNTTISGVLSGRVYNSANGLDFTEHNPMNPQDYRSLVITYKHANSDVIETMTIPNIGTYTAKSGITSSLSWAPIGVSAESKEVRYSFGEGMTIACERFGYYTGAIFRGLGNLFTPSGWSNISGIVGVFRLSSQYTQLGAQAFLSFWAMISINLAIVNLLPIPGLDGWQLLLTLIEGGAIRFARIKYRLKHKGMSKEELKEVYAKQGELDLRKVRGYKKFKQIASTVGLILLVALMVALIVKDIIMR